MPAPSQCGSHFSIAPPVTGDTVLGPQTLDLSSGKLYQPFVCNGVHTYSQRTFCNEMPFALPIPLHHFSSKGLITDPIICQIPFVCRTDSTNWEAVLSGMEHIKMAASDSNLSGSHMVVHLRVDAADPEFYPGL